MNLRMKEQLTEYIILIFALIALSISSLIMSIITGPQIAHFINLFSIIIAVWLTLRLLKKYSTRIQEIWSTNRNRMILGIFGLLTHLIVAFAIVTFRYGYTNWVYKNPIELIPPNTEFH